MDQILLDQENDPADSTLQQLEFDKAFEIEDATYVMTTMAKEKSRVSDVLHCERNSAYFHATIKMQQERAQITEIKNREVDSMEKEIFLEKQKIKVEEHRKKGDVKKEGEATKEDSDNRDIEELKLTIGKLQFQKHVLIEQLKLCHEEIMELKDKQGAMSDKGSVTENMIGMGKKRQEIDYIYLGFECQTCRKEYTNDNLANAEGKGKKTTIKVDSESMPLENLTKDKLRDVATSPLWKFLDDDQKAVVQTFFNQASKSTIAWTGDDFNIKGIVLEDLMFNKFLSNEIIDWFMSYLRENNQNTAKSKFFHSMCKRDKVTELVNKRRYRESKKLLPTDSPIQVMDCPQQCSPEDNAVYVCKFMQWSYKEKNQFLFQEGNFEEKIQKTRAKFAYKILSDKIARAKAYEADKYVIISWTGKTAYEAAIAFYNSSYFSKGALSVSDALTRAAKVAVDLGTHAGKK
ncbi:hypothetical protein IFM89_032164 [Coptis chinensis]|uniref:Uncharacterized protein n=1 Tax=Coptis chinensis TaxID=261450 RepID=A0A835IW94_9MAGN|nr:hypothetical protein IFM89_032164 [Coptis chinensis]